MPKKKYFITKLKAFTKLKDVITEIKYEKNIEIFSTFCRKFNSDKEIRIDLTEINLVTDQEEFEKNQTL